ncbi:hypothetical protein [Methylobacterium sp. A52T]
MRAAGADFRPDTKVQAFSGDAGQVRRAQLLGGAEIAADLVIIALGATRDTGWLAAAGLVADPGRLTCDAACRAVAGTGEHDGARSRDLCGRRRRALAEPAHRRTLGDVVGRVGDGL